MINADVYSEVYEILSYMDKSTVMKIPMEILNNIKENRNVNYVSAIDSNDLFNLNNLKKETVDVLICLDINFWMNDIKKNKLKKQYLEKNTQKQEELKQQFQSQKLFDNNNSYNLEKNTSEIISNIIEYKESFFKIIIKKIKMFFNNDNQ